MTPTKNVRVRRKSREQLVTDGIPQFERFIESRESYIKALETTVSLLKEENSRKDATTRAIRTSIDELVATQQLAHAISTAMDPDSILNALIELSHEVVPVLQANIFLFSGTSHTLSLLSPERSRILQREAEEQMEAGIIDWLVAEKKTVVIPSLDAMVAGNSPENFVLVPLILRSQGIGVFMIRTTKSQRDFSTHDLQLLSVLANQAVVGIEHWRTSQALVRADQEVKSSQAQMMQAAKLAAIGELAAGIAHEIKNPLQVMMLHLSLVQSGRPMENWIEMFNEQLRRLSNISVRLMDFARTASEEITVDPVDLNQAVEAILAIMKPDFDGNKIRCERSLAENLPSVRGNANYLQQVFLNLLINARDAMPEGGKVTVETRRVDSTVSVRISDTGVGMTKEVQEKIFRPFFSTKGEKGTGLGLAVCAKIVSQLKGELRVESTPGAGATFTISLPLWRPIP